MNEDGAPRVRFREFPVLLFTSHLFLQAPPLTLSHHSRPGLFWSTGTDSHAMDEDSHIRCPACGSAMTRRLSTHLWECRYHLCRVVFPVGRIREKSQAMLVAEEEAPYNSDCESG